MTSDAIDRSETGPAAAQSAGFAAQAARLVEAARANERAVRDLGEAAQILAAGVDDLVQAGDLAQAVRGLAEKADAVRGASVAACEAVEAAGDLDRMRASVEEAVARMRSTAGRLDAIEQACSRLDGLLLGVGERLDAALAHAAQADLDAALGRIDALERKVDRVLGLLEAHGDAYEERFEPRVAELERIAERMDAPALADELADVLAADYRLFEAIDAMCADQADARTYWDGVIDDWHARRGAR